MASILCFFIGCFFVHKLHRLAVRARHGDVEAATELLFPVYRQLIIAFSISYLMDGVFDAVWGPTFNCGYARSACYALVLGLRRCLIDGTALFLMRHGAGKRSVRATAVIALPWSVIVAVIEFLWRLTECDR